MIGGLDLVILDLVKTGVNFVSHEYAVMTNGSLYGCFKFLEYAIYLWSGSEVLNVLSKKNKPNDTNNKNNNYKNNKRK